MRMTGWPKGLIPIHAASGQYCSGIIFSSGDLGSEFEDRQSGKLNGGLVEPDWDKVVVD